VTEETAGDLVRRARPARSRLDPGIVVRAALELLHDKGLDAVSIRGTAGRLGVRMNTVLWHAKTKARLLELMADAVVAAVPLTELPEPWEPRVRALAHRYRRALLAHRDGAALVTGTYAAEPATLRFADTMVGALLGGGHGERAAAWASRSLIHFVLGHTQEEQTPPATARLHFTWALAAGGYPALNQVATYLVVEGLSEESFEYGLSLILRSLGANGNEGEADGGEADGGGRERRDVTAQAAQEEGESGRGRLPAAMPDRRYHSALTRNTSDLKWLHRTHERDGGG
jgi:AcrR family transcriptional regulator